MSGIDTVFILGLPFALLAACFLVKNRRVVRFLGLGAGMFAIFGYLNFINLQAVSGGPDQGAAFSQKWLPLILYTGCSLLGVYFFAVSSRKK